MRFMVCEHCGRPVQPPPEPPRATNPNVRISEGDPRIILVGGALALLVFVVGVLAAPSG